MLLEMGLISSVKSSPHPKSGQSHRSSDNFVLRKPPSGFIRFECSDNRAGFKVYQDKIGTDKVIYRYIANGSVMPFNGDEGNKYYIADPCDANADFVVSVYEAEDSEYVIASRGKPLNGEDHRSSENFSIDERKLIFCNPDVEFDIKKDTSVLSDSTVMTDVKQGDFVNPGTGLYIANPKGADEKLLIRLQSASDVMYAYSRPVDFPGLNLFLHHTYLRINDTLFTCHGNRFETCQNPIMAENGDYDRSVARANGEVEVIEPQAYYNKIDEGDAEIQYMRTGVCHQIANRILIPTGKSLDYVANEVGGYGYSTHLFGTYGSDAQDYFRRHPVADSSVENNPFAKLYLNADTVNEEDLLTEDFRLYMELVLGRKVSKEEVPIAGAKARRQLYDLQQQAIHLSISENQYGIIANEVFRNAQLELADEIKDEVMFRKLFGVNRGETVLVL